MINEGTRGRADEYDEQRWLSLQGLNQMIDHWFWRPGWHVGRSFYTWHLTLQGVGFTDEVSDSDLAAIIDAAEKRCSQLSPFQLTVGPADADPQGVPLTLRPWEPIEDLRRTLRTAIGDVWGGEAIPEEADGFHPHVTVFYSNAAVDPAPLREALTELRSTPPADTSIQNVSLIRLNRDQKVYRWETVTQVALGAA